MIFSDLCKRAIIAQCLLFPQLQVSSQASSCLPSGKLLSEFFYTAAMTEIETYFLDKLRDDSSEKFKIL